MEAAVAKYVQLIERFASGAINAETFESSYLKMFKNESARLPDAAFSVLNQLFADVDAFCPDPKLRGQSDLDEDALRSRSLDALRELTAVAGKRVPRC
ncbi:MAG TPA: colicin immunity domain-containing protein [Pirellulales bacterium]|nr:colicin immunity domain-containing protein [Pirellulales bacterium]